MTSKDKTINGRGIVLNSEGPDMTVEINGTNTISTEEVGFACFGGNVYLTGSGSLEVNSKSNTSISHNGEKMFVVRCRQLKAISPLAYGFYGNNKATLSIEKYYSDQDITFQGSHACIGSIRGLKLDGVDFCSNTSDGGTPGCYFDVDKKCVCQNGENVLTRLPVKCCPITNKYGISIGGVEINNCNYMGVGSKYITGGGEEAVVYNVSNKELVLNNVRMDVGNNSLNCVYNEAVDGLKILVKGTCNLTSYHWSSINLWKNTTLQGDGTLKLTGDEGMLHATKGSAVTINNLNVEAEEMCGSEDTGGTLNINLTSAAKKIIAEDGIYDWTTINLSKNVSIVEPANATISKGAVVVGNSIAMNVVIKIPDAIKGIDVAKSVVTDIYDVAGRRLNQAKSGINIIRTADGKIVKVRKK